MRYEDVPGYVNACDVMVAPYNPRANPLRREFGIGSPLKLFVYMACQRPFVSPRVDPIQKIPSFGEAGVLVEAGSPGDLAGAVLRLLQDPESRERMGLRGRTLVEREFAWGPLAVRISSMIQGV